MEYFTISKTEILYGCMSIDCCKIIGFIVIRCYIQRYPSIDDDNTYIKVVEIRICESSVGLFLGLSF